MRRSMGLLVWLCCTVTLAAAPGVFFRDGGPHGDNEGAVRRVDLDPAVLSQSFVFSIEGREFRAEPDRSRAWEDGGARFQVEGAPALSTVTSNGTTVAGYLVTPEGAYSVVPFQGAHVLFAMEDEGFTCVAHEPEARPGKMTAHGASGGRRRAVQFGRPLEVVEHRIGIRFHSRLAEALGGEENAKLIVHNAVQVLATILVETGETGVRPVLVSVKNVAEATGKIGRLGLPDYAEPLMFAESFERFASDERFLRERYEEQLTFMSYWDDVGIGGGAATTFDGVLGPRSGLSMIGWSSKGGLAAAIHEFGHGFGLYHGRDEYATPRRCSYCYAWTSCELGRKDVMGSGPCFMKSYLFYSNANRIVDRAFVGSPESNAVRRIAETRYVLRDSWKYALP